MRYRFLSLIVAGVFVAGFAAAQNANKKSAERAAAAPAPLSPAAAPGAMTLPEGFHATLFAGEPDVVQPMSFTFDDRGRLWVVECLTYPQWITDGSDGPDRIVIFEDSDGDGRFDSRKVFYDHGTNFAGIELGFGGVWVCATPNLLFIPDKDGDDKPDGPPRVVLDGWDLKAKHNVFNGLTWGPDGWLYGCNGILSNSSVGKPGATDDQRVQMNCGVWRYHPVTGRFEVVAHGTTNPWGLDFDENGQIFITNCVIKHLFHVIPGAHYVRMFGQDIEPNSYGLLQSCADHIHWGGGNWTDSRGGQGIHDAPGGGHAHVGCMIYLGDNWPQTYRGHLFTCNLHGNRVNQDLLAPRGSGYVATHGHDFLKANDTWFRGLELKYGPDGGVYVTDWNDTGECHDADDVHRESGRIYKVTWGKAKPVKVDLAKLGDAELVKLHGRRNAWYVRHARRLLQERAAAGADMSAARAALDAMIFKRSVRDPAGMLRAMWTLHAIGGLSETQRRALMTQPEPYVRGWAIQLELEDGQVSAAMLDVLAQMARKDDSPVVRLFLASGLQRLPVEQRWPIAQGLVSHGEDADDANLPLMIWYGVEPLAAADKDRALALAAKAKIPLVRQYIARRVAQASK